MPIPAQRVDASGQLIPFVGGTAGYGWTFKSRGIRDGTGGGRTLKMGNSYRRVPLLFENQQPDQSSIFWDAMVWLLGAASLYLNGDGKQRLSRIMPWTDQLEPRVGITEVGAKGLAFTEDAGFNDVPVADYNALDLDCTAEVLPYPLLADDDGTQEYLRYVEELPDQPSAQYLSMPGALQGLRFVKSGGSGGPGGGDPIRITYNVGFPFIKARIRRKWYRVPKEALETGSALFKRLYGDPADDTVYPYIGTCNLTSFLGFAKGTLVLLAPEKELVYDQVASEFCWNITYNWDWLPHGANYLYYFDDVVGGGNSGWYLASRGAFAATPGDKEVLHPLREHADIFVVGEL